MKRNALLNPLLRKGFILPAVVVVLTIASILFFTAQVQAANGIQKTINFQGKVTNADGTNVADGAYDFVIRIYDGAGNSASALFTETWSNAALFSSTMSAAPTTSDDSLTYSSNTNEGTLKVGQILWNTTKKESVIITSVNTGTNTIGISRTIQNWTNTDTITNRIYVKDGVFRVSINSLNADLSVVNFNSDTLFVGVNFNADGEMKPRMQLRANAYAMNAEKVNGLTVTNTSDNPFTSTTTLKIGDGKTVVINNGLTFSGTDSTTFTFPNATGTVVTLDAIQTLTNKTIGSTGLTFSGATTDITTGVNEDLVIIPNGSGNVGIGLTTPRAKLDVLGSASVSGSLVFNGAGTNTIDVFNGDRLDFQTSPGGDAGLTAKLSLLSNGSFGIGTSSPEHKLQVNGAATGKALVALNESGNQAVFTASSAGITRFTINNNGSLKFDGTQYANCRLTTDVSGNLVCSGDNTGSSRFVVKGSDQNIASGTTLTDDTALSFSVGANETWTVSYFLRVTNINNATPDWKAAVKGASGWTCSVTQSGEEPAGAVFPQATVTDCDDVPAAMVNNTIVADVNIPFQVRIQGTVTTNSSGPITLQWAPNTSGSLTVMAGSYVQAQKVGGTDGVGTMTIRETDASISVGNVTTLEFGPTSSSGDEFVITDETAGISRVRIGTQVGMLNQAETVTGGWTFNTAATTFTTAINANGGITLDNASDTISAFTSSGTINMNTNILENIGNTGTDFIATTGALNLAGVLTANGGITVANGQTLDANGQADIGDGGDSITLNGSALALQTTGAGSDITVDAVDQIILTDFANCTALETSSGVLTCGTDDGGTTLWSGISNPSGNLALTMSTNTSSFNWATGTSTNNLFSLTTDASANGTGALLNLQTGTSSTVLPLRVRAGATEALIVNADGNVGIGVTNPGVKLDVAGTFRTSSSVTFSNLITDANAVLYTTTGGVLTRVAETETGSLCLLSGAGASGVPTWGSCGGSSSAWSSINNPSTNLALSMSTNTTAFNWATGTSTNNLFSLTTDASANGTGALLNLQTGTSSTILPLRVRAGATEALLVNANGNVGIGTTLPDGRLHVAQTKTDTSGFQHMTLNVLTVNNGSASTGTFVSQWNRVLNSASFSVTELNGLYNEALQQGTGTVGSLVGSSTNIKVTSAGDVTAAYGAFINTQLTAAGTIGDNIGVFINEPTTFDASSITRQTGIQIQNLASGASNTHLLIGDSTQTGNFGIYNASTYDNYFAGNVGIGTTAPIHKLHVNTAATGKALVMFNESGNQDVLTASVSGTTVFRIANTGQTIVSNQGVEFIESDTNPACASGNYTIYADLSESKLKKCQNGVASDINAIPDMNSFTDATTEAWVDADTTNLWDGTIPNITPKATTSEILVLFTGTLTTTSATDVQVAARIFRNIGASPTCQTTGTSVYQIGTQTGFTAGWVNMSAAFVDAPSTTSNVTYTVCTDADSEAITGVTNGTMQITLFEINDAADLAEVYPTNDQTLEAGEVVSLDSALTKGVKRSSKAHDGSAIGVVSTKPALVIGGREGEGIDGKPIALSGRVPVKVKGHVKKGDVLTTSSTPGVAMKATKAGPILGIAMTDYDGATVGTVMLSVKTGYFTGSNLVDLFGEVEINATPGTTAYAQKALTYLLRNNTEEQEKSFDASAIYTDRVVAGLEVITPRVVADEVIARLIRADRIEGFEFVHSDMAGLTMVQDEQRKRITDLENLIATQSARPVVLGITTDGAVTIPTITPQAPIAGQSGETLKDLSDLLSQTDTVVASDYDVHLLTVEGLSVDQAATVSGTLRVKGNSIIEGILNVVDTLTAHNLIVSGISQFLGQVIFKDTVEFEKTPVFTDDTAGYTSIAKGHKTVAVTFSEEYSEEPIINATLVSKPLSDEEYAALVKERDCGEEAGKDACQVEQDQAILDEKVRYIITNRSKKGFTIMLPDDAKYDYIFSWTAISVKGKDETMPETAESDALTRLFGD